MKSSWWWVGQTREKRQTCLAVRHQANVAPGPTNAAVLEHVITSLLHAFHVFVKRDSREGKLGSVIATVPQMAPTPSSFGQLISINRVQMNRKGIIFGKNNKKTFAHYDYVVL